MKKLMLAACLIMGITATSFAQGGGNGTRKTPDEAAKLLQSQVKLSDDQTAKAKDIFTVRYNKIDSLRKVTNGDANAMREAIRPLIEATNAKLSALMTDEQKAAWKKVLDEQAARRRQGGNGGPSMDSQPQAPIQ